MLTLKFLLPILGVCMLAAAPLSQAAQAQAVGATCSPAMQSSTGWVLDTTYGYFTNKNTTTAVTVVCPLQMNNTAATTVTGYITVWAVSTGAVACTLHAYQGGANGGYSHGASVSSTVVSAMQQLNLGSIVMGAGGSAYVSCTLQRAVSSLTYPLIKSFYATY